MYSRVLHILLSATALFLAACSSDSSDVGRQTVADSLAIAFDAVDSTLTRASGDFNSVSELKDEPNGIGIFASYTGARRYFSSTVRPNFMTNQRAVWSAASQQTGAWAYAPLKYWPNGEGESLGNGQVEVAHMVSFFAYAPWSDLVTTSPTSHAPANCITRCSDTFDEGDPWLYYRIAGSNGSDPTSQQVDLLYAVCDYDYYGTTDGMCNIDLTKPDVAQHVHFIFHHALGCVGDMVTVSAASDLQDDMMMYAGGYKKVELVLFNVSIEYTLTAGALLSLWNREDAPNWQADTENNVKTTRRVTLLDNPSGTGAFSIVPQAGGSGYTVSCEHWRDTGHGVFYIPVEGDDYVQSATVTVSYSLRYYTNEELTTYIDSPATPVVGTVNIPLRDYIATKEAHGRNLNMNLRITAGGDIVATIVVVNVEANPWVDKDPSDREVYNW